VFCLALAAACSGASQENADVEARPQASSAGVQRERLAEVERMSVRGLVGQMFMISMGSTEPDYYVEKMIRERNIGGVLLFGYNMESEAQT
jgi:beta-N-acetylhexosaminidase